MNITTAHASGSAVRRMLAIAAVGAIALSLVFTLRVALANDLHQTPPISWDASGYGDAECDALDLAPGEVFWHFIQNQVADGTDSGKMTYEFDIAGSGSVDSYKKSGDTLHWSVITGHDTLLSASTDVSSDGEFNLSHICVGPPEESVAESQSQAESQSPEGSVEAGTGTPAGSQPNTSLLQGAVSVLPTVVFSLILLGSLGALAFANVKMARRRS